MGGNSRKQRVIHSDVVSREFMSVSRARPCPLSSESITKASRVASKSGKSTPNGAR